MAVSEVSYNIGGEKGPESRGSMSLFGVPSTGSGQALRLRLSQETAPNSAQDDEFNYEGNFRLTTLGCERAVVEKRVSPLRGPR